MPVAFARRVWPPSKPRRRNPPRKSPSRKRSPDAKSAPRSRLRRLRQICLALPEAHEVEAWGEPTFRVRNKLFAMHSSAGTHHSRGRPGVWIASTSCRHRTWCFARVPTVISRLRTSGRAAGSARGSTRIRSWGEITSCCATRSGSRRQRSWPIRSRISCHPDASVSERRTLLVGFSG